MEDDICETFQFCSLRKDYLLEKIDIIRKKTGLEIDISDELVSNITNAYESFVTELLEDHRDDDVLTAIIILCINEMQWKFDEKQNADTNEKLSKIEFKGDNPTKQMHSQVNTYLKNDKVT